jgi:hypothetical protein
MYKLLDEVMGVHRSEFGFECRGELMLLDFGLLSEWDEAGMCAFQHNMGLIVLLSTVVTEGSVGWLLRRAFAAVAFMAHPVVQHD